MVTNISETDNFMGLMKSTSPEAIVKQFYDAFSRRDGETMSRCYAPDVQFSDPVFPKLVGPDAGRMWRMLCKKSKDLKVMYSILKVDGGKVLVHWDAHYTFSGTGKHVHNVIQAEIVVRAGKIVSHHDHFSFWRWSQQALGTTGSLLGWTPILKAKVRSQAAKSLQAFTG
jgi:ketosteroid isomerase-like protein